MSEESPIKVLPLVKAYPNLSRSYGEVSCVAGLTLDSSGKPEWVRLYPIPFRDLVEESKFKKYEPIQVRARRPSNDRRPESRRVDVDSIKPSGRQVRTDHGWRERRSIVEPAISGSMCEIQRAQRRDGTSLGIFRPEEVTDLMIEEVEPNPEKGEMAEAWVAQGSLLGPPEQAQQRRALEQIPYRFKYRYRCAGPDCNGHEQSIVDWEIAQFYRHVRNRGDWRQRMRGRWLETICAKSRDTAFIVGNQHQHPQSFLVLGVWWPPKQPAQLSLSPSG
jgi:hypothetical protein